MFRVQKRLSYKGLKLTNYESLGHTLLLPIF
jgi:hypothetical protein